MRDLLARVAASGLVATVVLLAAFFAWRQNRPQREPTSTTATTAPEPAGTLDPELVERGARVYDVLSCSRCHALEGPGNPRSPLDGVGARRTRDEIRSWVTATPEVRRALPRSVARTKETLAAEIGPGDLDALVEYLASSR